MPETRFNLRTQQLQQRVRTGVATVDADTPIVFDNDPKQFPTDGTRIRCHISWGSRNKVSIGSRSQRHRQFGEVTVQIFTDLRIGPKIATSIFEAIEEAFRTRDPGLKYDPAVPFIIGERDGAYRVNVAIPFYFDETLVVT